MYIQLIYCLERVPAVVQAKPDLKNLEPLKTMLSGKRAAMAKFTMADFMKILAATLTGMTVDEFNVEAKKWLATAKHPRFKELYADLTYQPMREVMKLFRAYGYKTYFVTDKTKDSYSPRSDSTVFRKSSKDSRRIGPQSNIQPCR